MSASDIHVSGSTEETLGQVFIEAAMCGLPSVAFDVSGMQTSVAHGVSGELVSPFTSAALAEAMVRLHDDPLYRGRLSEMAPIFARNRFSLESSYHSFFQICKAMGLIDSTGVAHKISLASRSLIIDGDPNAVLNANNPWSIKRITAVARLSCLTDSYPQTREPQQKKALVNPAIVKQLYR